MDDSAGIWRFVQSVRVGERRRVVFFAGVASLIALGQTLGLAGAEALFLTRYGVQYLPQTFIFASGTTILVLTSLFFLGGPVIRPFAFAMLIGVVVGTYSSIYIAAPTLMLLEERYGK